MGHRALIIGSLKPIPDEVLGSELLDSCTVLTEAGCAHYYGADTDVSLVPSIDDLTAVRDAAREILAARNVDAVLAPTEFGVAVGGLLRSYFGIDGMGFDTAHAFANKYVMKRRLAAAGVPVTPFRQVLDLAGLPAAADALGWPVVVKPVFGSGTVGVSVVASEAGLRDFRAGPEAALLRQAGCPLIAERHVDVAAEYHADGVVVDGEPRFLAVSRYLAPVLRGIGGMQGSYQLPASHPDAAAVRELHRDAVRALGMRDGVTHLEVFGTASGFRVGEIACRPGGGGIVDSIALQYGVDMWQAYLETALGRPPTLDAVPADDVVVNVMLPARPGRITRLSAAEDLAGVPGVARVTMLHRPGDVISDVRYSTNITGLVYLIVPSPGDVDRAVRAVADAYEFAVSPADPVPA
ncbi:hypothetical protein [Streptomyces sp. B6B3]|uniref:ATP-grasp domain-containing protein n=1 Tax=Streptomyces sp. B6B3 TaxID=3153570 RepID=UPI00325E8A20